MKHTNFILIALLLSTFSASVTLADSSVREEENFVLEVAKKNNSEYKISNILHKKGIQKNKAIELTRNIITTDPTLFTFMTESYATQSKLSLKNVYSELANYALYQKNVDFTSYSFLVKFTHSIKKVPLSASELKNIEQISNKEQLIYDTFA